MRKIPCLPAGRSQSGGQSYEGEGHGIRMAQIDSPWAPLGEGAGLPEGSLKDSAGLEIGKSSVVFFPP